MLTAPVCPNCANLLTIIKTDPEPEVICRTCPYTCSIREIAIPKLDSDEDENTTDDENADDNHAVDDTSVSSQAKTQSEVERYTQAAMEEVRQRLGQASDDPIPCLSVDQLFPNQAFEFPSRAPIPNLKKPPLRHITKHILVEIGRNSSQSKRYGEYLESIGTQDIEDSLYNALTPSTKEAFQKPSIGIAELIDIGGEPERDEGAGVYLHILKTDTLFYLYVGQALILRERIQDHNNPEKRAKHPSLHYKIWAELEKMPGFESIFVKLASNTRPRDPDEQLRLNLQEMFLACVLQTLKSSDLGVWLPENLPRTWEGIGLNISPPLWQPFSVLGDVSFDELKMTKVEFSRMLHDSDELRRQWAIATRDAYQTLRTHPDPRMQAIWFSAFRKFVESHPTNLNQSHPNHVSARDNMRAFFSAGKSLPIFQGSWGYYQAQYCEFRFELNHLKPFCLDEHRQKRPGENDQVKKRYGKIIGKTAFLRPMVFERPTTLRYARKASITDPCARLMVVADTDPGDGTGQLRPLSCFGTFAVVHMNRLVDIFEGVEYSESLALGHVRRKLK